MTDMTLDDAPDGAAAGGAPTPTLQIYEYETVKDNNNHTWRKYPDNKQRYFVMPQLVNGHQLLVGEGDKVVVTETNDRVGAWNHETSSPVYDQIPKVMAALFPEQPQMGQNFFNPPPLGAGPPPPGAGPPPPGAGPPPPGAGEIVPYNKVEDQTLGKMIAKNQQKTEKAGHKIRDIEIKKQEAAVVQKKAAEIFQVTLVSNPCLYRLY